MREDTIDIGDDSSVVVGRSPVRAKIPA